MLEASGLKRSFSVLPQIAAYIHVSRRYSSALVGLMLPVVQFTFVCLFAGLAPCAAGNAVAVLVQGSTLAREIALYVLSFSCDKW